MKAVIEHDVVATNLKPKIGDEIQYGIKQDNQSHILSILRDQLYSNKILAVVREYMTNAVDAHVDAGTPDKPIKVTLPNQLDPELKIRDYGKSLDQQQIWEVFAYYGSSTKRETNTQTGFLGIGSKSAFAYTDTFTIVSYKDGTKTTYLSYIDETQNGKITKISEVPTDEETGLEIRVPVQVSDFKTLQQTVEQLGAFFDVPPIVNSVTLTKYDEYSEPIFSNELGVILDGDGLTDFLSSDRDLIVAVMGNIPYIVDDSKIEIPKYVTTKSGKRLQTNYLINNYVIVLKCQIGDFQISASRESIQYRDRVVQFLTERLTTFLQDAVEFGASKVANSATFEEAIVEYNRNSFGLFDLYSDYNSEVTWNDHKVWSQIYLQRNGGLSLSKFWCRDEYLKTLTNSVNENRVSFTEKKFNFYVVDDLCRTSGDKTSNRYIISRIRSLFNHVLETNTTVRQDGKTLPGYQALNQTMVNVITPVELPDETLPNNPWVRRKTLQNFELLSRIIETYSLDQLHGSRFFYLSELEEMRPLKPEQGHNGIKTIEQKDYHNYSSLSSTGNWIKQSETIQAFSANNSFLYCCLSYNNVTFPMDELFKDFIDFDSRDYFDKDGGIFNTCSEVLSSNTGNCGNSYASNLRFYSFNELVPFITGYKMVGVRKHMLPFLRKQKNAMSLHEYALKQLANAPDELIRECAEFLLLNWGRSNSFLGVFNRITGGAVKPTLDKSLHLINSLVKDLESIELRLGNSTPTIVKQALKLKKGGKKISVEGKRLIFSLYFLHQFDFTNKMSNRNEGSRLLIAECSQKLSQFGKQIVDEFHFVSWRLNIIFGGIRNVFPAIISPSEFLVFWEAFLNTKNTRDSLCLDYSQIEMFTPEDFNSESEEEDD